MTEYRRLNMNDMQSVKRLYEEAGWTAYLLDDGKLNRAWENSLFTLGAFDGGELIGEHAGGCVLYEKRELVEKIAAGEPRSEG